ncbi:MAG: ABC transporter ATP-binding protein [Bryobacteraceae bacterium]|nr:ABC transporter ATP-binding protein [Bryobacteraceae bacterium]
MILLQNVSKSYRLYRRPSDQIREMLPLRRRSYHRDFWALRGVNLRVERGETLGVIGPNGSGKSTLLQVVSGIVPPTAGRVVADGRVAALLELGAGFNPEFSGRENVYLSGEIMGLIRAQIDRLYPSIAGFAELGDFIDRPVKEYSSGMYVRLAFATAIHVDPEILIVDEALAVGDAIFSNRCIQKFDELKARGVTILFVSHDLGLVKQLADRAVFLLNGRIEAEGVPSDVVNRYVGMVLERKRLDEARVTPAAPRMPSSFRHGDGASRITKVALLNASGAESEAFHSGERATARIHAQFHSHVDDPVVGVLIRNRLGIDVFGTNSRIEQKKLGTFGPGDQLEIDFSFDCQLTGQDYTLTVATQNWDGTSQDWLDDVLMFRVIDTRTRAGVASLKTEITWTKR